MNTGSHPMRVRGLKLYLNSPILGVTIVAPHAGAWIETTITKINLFNTEVAPHAGAWIETYTSE